MYGKSDHYPEQKKPHSFLSHHKLLSYNKAPTTKFNANIPIIFRTKHADNQVTIMRLLDEKNQSFSLIISLWYKRSHISIE